MKELQDRLHIPTGRLDALNGLLVDPKAPAIKEFLAIVAAYGTPKEINAKAAAARKPEALLKKIEAKNKDYLGDIEWLMNMREKGAFIGMDEYGRNLLGGAAAPSDHSTAVTLEVSALQYFPWIRAMCERAIRERNLVPGRFIAVRKMKESEADGDLPAILAAVDIMGASFVETLDTKGTDGSNPHLGGPATITGYFGGIGQPNEHALAWVKEFLYYYTNYGVQDVLNFNAGTIFLGFLLYKLGVDIHFKISVFFGSDNPYHALWIMTAAKLFSRDDGSTPLVGFNWSNSVNNATIEASALVRKSLGFEECIRFEHHITETYRSIVIQPYNRREELLEVAARVPNISAKHEGADPGMEARRNHSSDILDYFRDKSEVIASGDWDNLKQNFLDKVEACNTTAEKLIQKGIGVVPAQRLHKA
ncbi:MAG: hypothetical protein PHT01_01135 [Spirochaetales bacterium]|jgi:hypothetical protein|nr:hypothetical protein [Spirochaetales bacterium]